MNTEVCSTDNPLIRKRVWEEMNMAKVYSLCLLDYTDKARSRNRWCNWLVTVVTAGGSLAYFVDPVIPAFAAGAAAIATFAKNTLPAIFQPESELTRLDELLVYYNLYLNDLEKLWRDIEINVTNEFDASQCFYKLKQEEAKKQPLFNKYIRNIKAKKHCYYQEEATRYLSRLYVD